MILISCKDAAHLCQKKEYREASLMDRVRLRLHLSMCRVCSVFARKNRQLTLLLNRARLTSLQDAEKEAMKKALREFNLPE